MRLSIRLIGLLVAGVAAGCVPATSPPPTAMPVVSAPESATARAEVQLVGGVSEPIDGLTYRWYQTAGRMVDLADADQPVARFIAPSLTKAQTLGFRLDVRDSSGRLTSIAVSVLIEADPNAEDTAGSGGTDGDDDPFPRVRLSTSMGDIVLELNRTRAPITVGNFLRYLDDGHYTNTIFHRVISEFVVQGGGYDRELDERPTRPPIKNEADNGLKNDRGTVAMARTNEPDSATSQFYINLKDNDDLNYTGVNAGYAVFGVVVEGMAVVDAIAEVETETRDGFSDIPVDDVLIIRAERVGGSGSSGQDGAR